MARSFHLLSPVWKAVVVGFAAYCMAHQVQAVEYHPITPTAGNGTVMLTGRDLTIEQVIQVARDGAEVQFAAGVFKRVEDQRNLRLEAAAEGIAVYGVDRGYGAEREITKPIGRTEPVPIWLNTGLSPEIDQEDLVRAIMVINANTGIYAAPSQSYMQMLLDLLNKRVTPVFNSRGALGDGDLPLIQQIGATMLGRGDAYYRGVRMKASEALRRAGLKPLTTDDAAGNAVGGDSYGDALATLLAYDGRRALEWADLLGAMSKLGMNSSLTPMSSPVQAARRFRWVNWEAGRTLDILRNSYLFEDDPKRILQDPESMRASYIRQGSAWKAWAALRDDVEIQINGSEQNALAVVGASPNDSWELSTPQMMKYYVKGGALSHGQRGFVLSNANWDPYPMMNDVEAFTNALANLDAPIAQTIERFTDRGPTAFFTGIKPADVMTPEQRNASPQLSEPYFVFMDIWAEIQNLSRSVTPEGNAADLGIADVEAFSRIKGNNGRKVVDLTMQLLAYDLLTSTYWMDVRKAEDSKRNFGTAPTAAWQAFRKVLPWQQDPNTRPEISYGNVADSFLRATPASMFYSAGPTMPDTEGH